MDTSYVDGLDLTVRFQAAGFSFPCPAECSVVCRLRADSVPSCENNTARPRAARASGPLPR